MHCSTFQFFGSIVSESLAPDLQMEATTLAGDDIVYSRQRSSGINFSPAKFCTLSLSEDPRTRHCTHRGQLQASLNGNLMFLQLTSFSWRDLAGLLFLRRTEFCNAPAQGIGRFSCLHRVQVNIWKDTSLTMKRACTTRQRSAAWL